MLFNCVSTQMSEALLQNKKVVSADCTYGQALAGLWLQDCKIWIAFLFGGMHLDLKSIPKKRIWLWIWLHNSSDFAIQSGFAIQIDACNPDSGHIKYLIFLYFHTLYFCGEHNSLRMMCNCLATQNAYCFNQKIWNWLDQVCVNMLSTTWHLHGLLWRHS